MWGLFPIGIVPYALLSAMSFVYIVRSDEYDIANRNRARHQDPDSESSRCQ